MGWEGVTVMDQRVRFIAEYLNRFFPVNEFEKAGFSSIYNGFIDWSFINFSIVKSNYVAISCNLSYQHLCPIVKGRKNFSRGATSSTAWGPSFSRVSV